MGRLVAPAQLEVVSEAEHAGLGRHGPAGESLRVVLDDGRALAVRRWPGSGTPVVLLHGLFDCGLGWKGVAASTPRPCVAIDLPGFGESAMPESSQLGSYARDILDVLDAVGVGSFSLVGHSFGGGVAAALAELAPERTLNLTLMAPSGFSPVAMAGMLGNRLTSRVVRRALPLALANPVSAVGLYMLMVSNGHTPDPELLKRVMRRAFNAAPGAAAANETIVAAGKDPDGFAHRRVAYDGTVSVLWGKRDVLVPASHFRAVRAALPQATFTFWDGMGHHPQRERPEQLNAYLQESTLIERPLASAKVAA